MSLSGYDKYTRKIHYYLGRLPWVGKAFQKAYGWRPTMFNFMIVGSSGTLLNWFLYEGVLRPVMLGWPLGTFWALAISTFLVFLWNYFLNLHWSLSIRNQQAENKNQ